MQDIFDDYKKEIWISLFFASILIGLALKYCEFRDPFKKQKATYTVEELIINTIKCPESEIDFSSGFENPLVSTKCKYKALLEKLKRSQRNFTISEILFQDSDQTDTYLLDNQLIVRVPEQTFTTKRKLIFKALTSELRKIKEYFQKYGIKIDSNFFFIRFFENTTQLNRLLDLKHDSQAVTIPCRYIGMPLTPKGSIKKKQNDRLKETFRHELMHAVLCSITGPRFFKQLPQWVIEGSAVSYADETDEPELLSYDKEKMIFIRTPYVRTCFRRIFEDARALVIQAIKQQALSPLAHITQTQNCQPEREKCIRDCRKSIGRAIEYELLKLKPGPLLETPKQVSLFPQAEKEAQICASQNCKFILH